MNNHATVKSISEWRVTPTKKRIARVKDLKKYLAWCERTQQGEFQIAFARREIQKIKQSIEPAETNEEIKKRIDIELETALRITEYENARDFTKIKSWFKLTERHSIFGDKYCFAMSCVHNGRLKHQTFPEQQLTLETCNAVANENIAKAVDASLNRIEDTYWEELILRKTLEELGL